MSRKRVVVVGGGVAGSLVAKKLENDADVFLVDAKDFFEVPYAGARCIVEPSFGEKSCVLHTDYMAKPTHVVTNSAKTASKTEVVTERGEHIGFDFLVVATGNAHGEPCDRKGRLQELEKENKKLQSAKAVLIVGGGPVGVELAGEVVTDFPNIKVTLVHSGSRLLEFICPSASKKALEWLMSRNVEVILDDAVTNLAKSPYVTKKGKTIPADAHFLCVGKQLGNSWLRQSEFKHLLDAHGRLKVDETLRLPGYPNVFAVGDITDMKEVKQGYFAAAHAGVVIQNIKKLIKNPNCKQLNKYKPSTLTLALVSLGRHSAICQTPCCVLSGRLPASVKCNDFFVNSTRKQLALH